MKVRLILASFLLVILGTIVLFQAFRVQTAQAAGPITSPISYFYISGRVIYKYIYFYKPASYKPAANVSIIATNTQNSSASNTLTDTQGYYGLKVEAGNYSVKASDAKRTSFRPSEILVNVLSGDVSNINFLGVIR